MLQPEEFRNGGADYLRSIARLHRLQLPGRFLERALQLYRSRLCIIAAGRQRGASRKAIDEDDDRLCEMLADQDSEVEEGGQIE
jgi:hypothetical protein